MARVNKNVNKGLSIVGTALSVVSGAYFFYRRFKDISNDINNKKVYRALANRLLGLLGTVSGMIGGIVLGGVAGSAVPVIGTVVGAIVGGIWGALFGGSAFSYLSKQFARLISYLLSGETNPTRWQPAKLQQANDSKNAKGQSPINRYRQALASLHDAKNSFKATTPALLRLFPGDVAKDNEEFNKAANSIAFGIIPDRIKLSDRTFVYKNESCTFHEETRPSNIVR